MSIKIKSTVRFLWQLSSARRTDFRALRGSFSEYPLRIRVQKSTAFRALCLLGHFILQLEGRNTKKNTIDENAFKLMEVKKLNKIPTNDFLIFQVDREKHTLNTN